MDKRKIIQLGLVILMVGSFGMYIFRQNQSMQGEDTYREAQQIAQEETTEEPTTAPPETEMVSVETEPVTETILYNVWQEAAVIDDPYMEELSAINLNALREVNADVVGWIEIPDTKLSYPLMPGTEGDYYLNRTWEKVSSIAGSIFIENLCSDDLTDFNTVIYGHRMNDGSMFGSLKYYNKKEYWEEHPYVYICDDSGVHRYEIFAAYEGNLKGSTYQIGFANDEYKQKFLENCVGYSMIDTGVVPTIDDKIITLSTCTGRGYESRWVVQARLKGEVVPKLESEIEEGDIVLGIYGEIEDGEVAEQQGHRQTKENAD